MIFKCFDYSSKFFILYILKSLQSCRVAKDTVSRCVSRSLVGIEWGGGGDCRAVTFVLAAIVGSGGRGIHLRHFTDVDFNV